MTTVVLTIRQPFTAAVFRADPVKNIENRSWVPPWPVPFRMFIHAATRDYPGWQEHPMARVLAAIPAEFRELRGVLLGRVTVTGVVRDSSSPWARPGQWHWVLADPRFSPTIPLSGTRGFWSMEKAIRAQYMEEEEG
jgi:hypothetical protein